MASPVAIGDAPGVSTGSARWQPRPAPLLRVRTWLARSRLDAEIAQGVRRPGDPALALRESQLIEMRQRRRLAARLEEVVAPPAPRRGASSRAPVDRSAVAIATPLLTDLALLLRSPDAVEATGMALGWRLITDPGSPLYEVEERGASRGERLWRESSEVLDALRPK